MNQKIVGISYILIAILIIVVKYAIPGFFDILIWLIAIILIIAGIYLFLKKSY